MSHFLFLQDLVQEGIREGAIRDLDPPLLFCMMASSLSGLIARVSMTDDPAERGAIIEQGLDIVWNGLKAEGKTRVKSSTRKQGKE
jgi:hypothetical protein